MLLLFFVSTIQSSMPNIEDDLDDEDDIYADRQNKFKQKLQAKY